MRGLLSKKWKSCGCREEMKKNIINMLVYQQFRLSGKNVLGDNMRIIILNCDRKKVCKELSCRTGKRAKTIDVDQIIWAFPRAVCLFLENNAIEMGIELHQDHENDCENFARIKAQEVDATKLKNMFAELESSGVLSGLLSHLLSSEYLQSVQQGGISSDLSSLVGRLGEMWSLARVRQEMLTGQEQVLLLNVRHSYKI